MIRYGLSIGLAVAVLASCAQPPTRELEIAASRVETARSADAEVFAPGVFAEAERSLEEAMRLESEREYRAAIHSAAHSTLRANEATREADAERTVAVRRLDQILFELEGLIEMAAQHGAAIEARDELEAFRASYGAIRRMAEERDFLDALAAGAALKPELLAFEERFRRD